MECIFNELSVQPPAKDKLQAREWMTTLLHTCKEVNKLCTKGMRLRVTDNFQQVAITDSYTIRDWLFDKITERNSRSLLLRIMDSPCIGKKIQEREYILMKQIIFKDAEVELETEGLGIAYLTGEEGSLSISFNSHPNWDKSLIPLLYFENSVSQPRNVEVRHGSKPEHVAVHKVWILKSNDFDWTKWQPSLDKLLPRACLSNKLVDDDWDAFRKELSQHPPDRNAKIDQMARQVAEINGYRFNQKLSSYNQRLKNSLRTIYETGESRQKMYLSTDFEKGAFEVCDYRGKHLGEYNFSGKKTGDADKDGRHDIFLI